jgi:hypothetical protein
MNLLDSALKLKEMFRSLMEADAVLHLSPARKSDLQAMAKKADEIMEALTAFDEHVLSLRTITEEAHRFSANREYWETLPSGLIKGGSPEFMELQKNSETITDLYRAAIDIQQIVKFSAEEIELAVSIGNDFRKFHEVWRQLKVAIARRQDLIETRVDAISEIAPFFSLLRKFGVVARYATAVRPRGSRTWVARDLQHIRHEREKDMPLCVKFEFAEAARNLIMGHWFNGYAHEVLQDQLKRLQADFEIYPLVSYKSSANVSLAKGEIDILARIRDHILVMECKSGPIHTESGVNEFREILRKFSALKEIFLKTRLAKFTFILVYNPFAVNEAAVRANVDSEKFTAISIDDLRGKIIDMIPALTRS